MWKMLSNNMTPSNATTPNHYGPRNSTGWDGKLRVEKRAVLANQHPLSDHEYSDQDAPPAEQIDADEGMFDVTMFLSCC